MKILANIQNKSIGGINRSMFSVLDYSLKNEEDVEFVLVQVDSQLNGSLEKPEVFFENSFKGYKCYNKSYPCDYYDNAFEKSDSFDLLKINLKDLIDFYKIVLKKENPDLVYINGTYYRPWCLLQAARDLKIKYIVHFHGSAYLESVGLNTEKRQIIGDMECDFYDPFAKFIFPSQLSLDNSLIFQKHPNLNYRIIFNSLDETYFINSTKNALNNREVAFILRWEKIKNTDFIIKFIKFNSLQPHPYQLTVVTDKEKGDVMDENFTFVKFIKPMSSEKLISFYKQVDLVINPSYFETFGYVPAETVACGTPVLISENQGIAEVFKRIGLTRLITNFIDEAEVFNKIDKIIKIGISKKEVISLKNEISNTKLINEIFEYIKQ